MSRDDLREVEVDGEAALLDWLEDNHAQPDSVWLVTFRKSVPEKHIPREKLLAALIRYGWIDSLPRAKDEQRTMLMISPRRPKSNWSAINRRIAEALMAAGRMHPAGQAKIDRAKREGRWISPARVEEMDMPGDLAAAFDRHPGARDCFDAFPPSVRFNSFRWIEDAKRAETRARRIEEVASLAARNIRAVQWPRPGKRRGS